MGVFESLSSAFPSNTFYRQEQGFTHRKLADVAMRAGRANDEERHLRKALAFYRELVAEVPGEAFFKQEATFIAVALADVHSRTGQLKKAADDLVEASKINHGDQTDILSRLALVRLAMQDEPGYRQTCATLVAQSLPRNPDGNAASQIALTCILLPDAGVDAGLVVRIAEQAVARNGKDPDYLIALGAALYRADRFEEAAKTLADAEAAYRREQATPTPGIYVITQVGYSHLFLAMTHHRLNHHEEAAQWLKKSVEATDLLPPASQPATREAWTK